MPRDPEFLIDILTALRRILRYTDGIDRIALEGVAGTLNLTAT